MAEYITKEAVIQAFEWGDADVFEDCEDGYISGFSREAIKNIINSIPAADVTPVVYGRWIWHNKWEPFEFKYECSICHDGSDLESKYCPHCGAKLGGGAE